MTTMAAKPITLRRGPMPRTQVHREPTPPEARATGGTLRAGSTPARPANDDTRALTLAIAAGDRDAFATFYDRWFDWSYARVRKATGRDEDFCLDVVHDAMLKVIRSITTMPSRQVLNAWLSRVLLNTARDRIKGDARRARRERTHAGARPQTGAPAHAGPAGRDEIAALDHQLASLDDTLRTLITARIAMGMTLERAGALLGLSPASTDRRVRKAIGAIRKAMNEKDTP